MTSMKIKNKAVITALFISSIGMLPNSNAWPVVCVNCGTEWTQIANQIQLVQQYSEQIRQTINQVKMIDDQIKNSKRLVDGNWGNAFEQINKLNELARQGQSIAYSASDLTSEMNKRYKGYEHWQKEISTQDFDEHYKQLSTSMGDSAGSALRVANGIYQQREEDDRILRQIQNRSTNANGRLEAIQAGNELSGQVIRQLQKMESLLSAQIQLTSTFVQAENEKEQLQKAQMSQFMQGEAIPLNNRKIETYQLKKF